MKNKKFDDNVEITRNFLQRFMLKEATTSYEDFIGDTARPMMSDSEEDNDETPKVLQLLDRAIKLGLLNPRNISYLKITGASLEQGIPEELIQAVFKEIQMNIARKISNLTTLQSDINSLVDTSTDKEDINF